MTDGIRPLFGADRSDIIWHTASLLSRPDTHFSHLSSHKHPLSYPPISILKWHILTPTIRPLQRRPRCIRATLPRDQRLLPAHRTREIQPMIQREMTDLPEQQPIAMQPRIYLRVPSSVRRG